MSAYLIEFMEPPLIVLMNVSRLLGSRGQAILRSIKSMAITGRRCRQLTTDVAYIVRNAMRTLWYLYTIYMVL